jgi:hypothetical protein
VQVTITRAWVMVAPRRCVEEDRRDVERQTRNRFERGRAVSERQFAGE